jgi:hypothetical protein
VPAAWGEPVVAVDVKAMPDDGDPGDLEVLAILDGPRLDALAPEVHSIVKQVVPAPGAHGARRGDCFNVVEYPASHPAHGLYAGAAGYWQHVVAQAGNGAASGPERGVRPHASLDHELAVLDQVLATFAACEGGDYPGVEVMRDSLMERRKLVARQLAHTEGPTLTLVLSGGSVATNTGLDVAFLAAFLDALEASLAAIARALTGEPSGPDGPDGPAGLPRRATLTLCDVTVGRVTLVLDRPRGATSNGATAPAPGDDGPEPVFERAVGRLLAILDAASVPERSAHQPLLGVLDRLGPRAHQRLQRLAVAVSGADADAEIRFTRPGHPVAHGSLTRSSAEVLQRVLAAVEAEEHIVRMNGRIAGVSLVRRTFELERADGSIIVGRYAEDLAIRPFIGEVCGATLRLTRIRRCVDASETESYVLIALK